MTTKHNGGIITVPTDSNPFYTTATKHTTFTTPQPTTERVYVNSKGETVTFRVHSDGTVHVTVEALEELLKKSGFFE